MNTFALDQLRNLPQGTIKRCSDGPHEYLDIEGKHVPLTLRPRQLWLSLLQRGITRAQVDGIIATLPAEQQEVARIEMLGHVYERLSPWIGTLGGALGLSESDIDDVFIAGAGTITLTDPDAGIEPEIELEAAE